MMVNITATNIVLLVISASVAMAARGSDEDWGMKKRARGSDEDWGMKKRARGSDEDWGMKRARGSDEDWGMKKRARGSDEDWGMKKRARGSDEDWGMKRARGSDEMWGMKKKSSQCARQGDSCFSTENCCLSYVCAVSDLHGLKPEVPGVCLHEKELTTCVSDANCKPQEYCAKINSNAYCVTRPSVALAAAIKPAATPKTAAAGLGAPCADTSDCLPQLASGEKLCCQKVSLGRQVAKQICDRATTTSTCISKTL